MLNYSVTLTAYYRAEPASAPTATEPRRAAALPHPRLSAYDLWRTDSAAAARLALPTGWLCARDDTSAAMATP